MSTIDRYARRGGALAASAPTLTYAQFKALDPCGEAFERVVKLFGGARQWGENGVTAAQAKEAGCTLDDLIWAASALSYRDKDVKRRLRLWMADCAARVLHIYERAGTSDAPRNAIIANRRFARGEIDDTAWAAAMDAAWEAAWEAVGDAAMDAIRAAAMASARGASRAAVWAAARDAARDDEDVAARTAARAAAWNAEEAWQLDRLVAWMSDDEPDDWPLPDRAAPDETRGRNSDIGRADPPAPHSRRSAMNEHTLVERLNIPWPDYETDEVTLPAWVIELCAEGAARIADLEAQLAELAAENERLRKDAERYRALRDGSLDDLAVVRGLGVVDYGLNVVLYTYLKEVEGDEMDNAIDAARRALKEVSDERA